MKARENTISVETYEALRSSILLARLEPGARITITELCERFGAGLGAVREALSHLRAEGLVQAEARRGYRVSPVSVADLRDLTQLRVDVETSCLTRSIECGEVEWEANLVAALHRLSKSYRENPPNRSLTTATFVNAHAAFHLALVSACDRPRLLRLRAQLFQESERYRLLNVSINRDRNAPEEHRLIAEATLARDVNKATKLLAAHIWRTVDDIINATSKQELGRHKKSRAIAKRKV